MKRSFASGRSSVRWRSEMKSVLNACVLLFLGGNQRHCFDDHRLARHVARERAAGPGRRLGDLGDPVLPRHPAAAHRASLTTGARVGFCLKLAAKPPPWTMKPSITRWKIVPL